MAADVPITAISHIAIYASDAAKSERFYVHDLGAVRRPDPENPRGVRYYFSPTQFVEVLPLPTGAPSINRLDHVALTTTDAERLRVYLKAPRPLVSGVDGSRWFDVTDPEGNTIQFVQPPVNPAEVPTNPLSGHIIHVGFVVHDRAAEDRFFRDILGFRPYWFGGPRDDGPPAWISQQVPNGTDWLEYMVVSSPVNAATLGVLNHFSLGVPNMQSTYTLLWNAGRLPDESVTPKIGRDAKWQLNLLDPDGTRAELMELHAIGKPCCSPFTAPDPQR